MVMGRSSTTAFGTSLCLCILAALAQYARTATLPSLPSYGKPLSYDVDPSYWAAEEGVGHFSEWSKGTKRAFVDDVRAGKASDWVIVMGNEGGGE